MNFSFFIIPQVISWLPDSNRGITAISSNWFQNHKGSYNCRRHTIRKYKCSLTSVVTSSVRLWLQGTRHGYCFLSLSVGRGIEGSDFFRQFCRLLRSPAGEDPRIIRHTLYTESIGVLVLALYNSLVGWQDVRWVFVAFKRIMAPACWARAAVVPFA